MESEQIQRAKNAVCNMHCSEKPRGTRHEGTTPPPTSMETKSRAATLSLKNRPGHVLFPEHDQHHPRGSLLKLFLFRFIHHLNYVKLTAKCHTLVLRASLLMCTCVKWRFS